MEFRVLGPLEVWSGGIRVALPSARQQRLLAALLLFPNTVVPISRLVEALWDDEPPATATKQVQNCVSAVRERLRMTGDQLIVTDGPGYRVAVSSDQLDLLRFRDGLERARALASAGRVADGVDGARRALALWRGPVLDGIGTRSLTSRAAGLAEQRLGAIEQCLDWELTLGHNREIVAELTEMVAEHPLREKPCTQLMLALDRGGRASDALFAFIGCASTWISNWVSTPERRFAPFTSACSVVGLAGHRWPTARRETAASRTRTRPLPRSEHPSRR